jgi:proteasome accessory factor C
MSGAGDHLPRLLALVPWLLSHPGSRAADVAREFGVTERQLRSDIDLLWVCGLPGYGPGDLMDVVWEGDRVTLSNADTIARPLRLTSTEALALVASLRALSGVPGIVDTGSVDRALAKLEAAAGGAVAADRVLAATPPSNDPGTDPEVTAAVTGAVARSRRIHLRYWVPARDEATERDVDPITLFAIDGAAYLVGWCRGVEDLRTFRLDRVLGVEVLDLAADVPAEARQRGLDAGLFTPDPGDRLITLSLDPAARWVADYHPVEEVQERGDGGLIVRLRARDDDWVQRLALGLAGAGRVLEPAGLAESVRSAAAATLALYDD